jgi:hypothetical protein
MAAIYPQDFEQKNDWKFNPAILVRLADSDGLTLIDSALPNNAPRACCACARPVAMPVTSSWRKS